MLTHLANYRQYIFEAALNDIRYRYAGTSLGLFWYIIHPAMTVAVYAAVFSGLIVANPAFNPGAPFVLYLCIGLVPWLCFTETLMHGSEAIPQHRLYLRRIPLPPEIFVAKNVAGTAAGLAVSIILVLLLGLLFGRSPGWTWLAVPVIAVLFEGLAFGLALSLATLRVLVRDVGELLRAILHLWTWTLPIVYPETLLPEQARGWLWFNPPYAFIHALRECVLNEAWPTLQAWTAMGGWLAAALMLGGFVLHRSRSRIKDAV
jgi:ABC-type polysaccharide/polyol phosphate export permease